MIAEDAIAAALDAYRSGWLTMGPRTQEFERRFAEWTGAAHVAAVSSGRAALALAGLVAPQAPVVEHVFGYPADVAPGAIEDCSEALGATLADGRMAGCAGVLGCFSFAVGRPLTCGEGGAVIGDDAALIARVRSLRAHALTSTTWDRHRGHAETYDVTDIGFNFRIDEPRAALLTSGLADVAKDIEARRAVARRYRERLRDARGIGLIGDDERASPLAFPIVLEQRDAVCEALARRGIPTLRHGARLCGLPLAGADAVIDALRAS